jgi:hypothetical protein
MTPPRRPAVAFALECLKSDEELVLLYPGNSKGLSTALKVDGVSDYYLRKINTLRRRGDGMGYKAKPWLEIKRILVKYR